MTAWVLRAGKQGEDEQWCLETGAAGAAWNGVGNMSGCKSRDEVRAMLTPYNAEEMELFKVIPWQKSSKGNSPKYIQPEKESDPSSQLSLLDMMFG